MSKITVIGSLNMDLVLEIENAPKVGQTIEGNNISYLFGGKGANQGVAGSRIGATVDFIGVVGNDSFGLKIKENMINENINIDGLKITEKSATGLATILKTKEDNSIVIIKGANEECNIELIEKNKEKIKNSDVVLTQFEIPMETIEKSLEIAKENRVKTIVNPAPAKKISEEILKNIDYITPNETEFEIICGKELKDDETLEKEMIDWQKNHKTRLIVTRGSSGVSFIENDEIITVEAMKVNAIDTTGAGDTFNGVFAYCIGEVMELKESIRLSSRAASISVTKFGAQGGMPSLEEVKKYYK
ncbi:MAG: ribokinase [Clostridium sp.]|uniref:ribokinase n=1 Tax=Clostridium sp. TaxID=1506 RepID=UPI003EE5B6E8